NGDGLVDGNDIALVQAENRQTVSSSNFREDVNTTGSIDGNDIGLVQAQFRTQVTLTALTQPVSTNPSISVQYGYDDDGKVNHLYATNSNSSPTGYDLTYGYDTIGRFQTISATGS